MIINIILDELIAISNVSMGENREDPRAVLCPYDECIKKRNFDREDLFSM